MGILDRINTDAARTGIVSIIAGARFSGKTTLAGTLTGNTLLLQAKAIEAGYGAAKELAVSNGNKLDSIEFETLEDLNGLLAEASNLDYNNIYIDSMSAVTDMRMSEPYMVKMEKLDRWKAYGLLANEMKDLIINCKNVASNTGKNVFITLALEEVLSPEGYVTAVKPITKGQKVMDYIKGMCPVFVTSRVVYDDKNNLIRQLVTKSDGPYPGRIGTKLDANNPGILEHNLTTLVNLIKGE